MGAERTAEELDQLAEFFQRLEEMEDQPFEAVRLLTMFMPDPGAVRQVEYRAYERANEARVEGNWGEAAHWSSTGDALAILAERAEKIRKE